MRQIGSKVTIRQDLNTVWQYRNEYLSNRTNVVDSMLQYQGKEATVIGWINGFYLLDIDQGITAHAWADEMFCDWTEEEIGDDGFVHKYFINGNGMLVEDKDVEF